MLQLMFFAWVIIITSLINHTCTDDQGQIPPATVFQSNEQYMHLDLNLSLDGIVVAHFYSLSVGFFLAFFFSFFFVYLPSHNLGLTPSGTYSPNARRSDACRGSNSLWTRTLDIRHIHKGRPPWMCGQHNVRASTGDNTGQNTKDTHPIPGQKLKFLTSPGIEPGPPGWKAESLPTTPRRRIWNIFKI